QLYGTYFQNIIELCKIDQNDHLIVTGTQAGGSTYVNISTPNAFQNQIMGGANVYFAKLNLNYSINWATYFGGVVGIDDYRNSVNTVDGLSVDEFNNIYFSGITNALINIASPGSHQQYNSAKTELAYLTKFDFNGNRLWGTYFGGHVNLHIQNPILVGGLTV